MKGLNRGHWKGWCPFLEKWLFGEMYEKDGEQYIVMNETEPFFDHPVRMAYRCERVTRMDE